MKTRKLLPFATVLLLASGCGGTDEQLSEPTVDVSGTWEGAVTSTDVGTYSATMSLSQVGADVTGTYAASTVGVEGTIVGTVSGSNVSFTIHVARPKCSIRFIAGAEVFGATSDQMKVAFNLLSTCGGPESGSATLKRM